MLCGKRHQATVVVGTIPRCKHGHPLVGNNVYLHPRTGSKLCRRCRAERHRAWNQKYHTRTKQETRALQRLSGLLHKHNLRNASQKAG